MPLWLLSWEVKSRKPKGVVLSVITPWLLCSPPEEQNQSRITVRYFGILTVSAQIFKAEGAK